MIQEFILYAPIRRQKPHHFSRAAFCGDEQTCALIKKGLHLSMQWLPWS